MGVGYLVWFWIIGLMFLWEEYEVEIFNFGGCKYKLEMWDKVYV